MGTEALLQQEQMHQQAWQRQQQRLERQIRHQQAGLIALGNALTGMVVGRAVEHSVIYRRTATFVRLLAPMDVLDARYVRVGRAHDGGYVMVDEISPTTTTAAYSFGLSDDVSWDLAIASRGIPVFQYDHTIEEPPARHPNCHFAKLGVTGSGSNPALRRLADLIEANGHADADGLILKLDIEGAEWDVFEHTPAAIIGRCAQIVVEWHGLAPAVYGAGHGYDRMVEILRRINATHQCVHLHANSVQAPIWIHDLVLPSLLEATYVSRARYGERLAPNTRQFPTEIDQATFPHAPDVYLGAWIPESERFGAPTFRQRHSPPPH